MNAEELGCHPKAVRGRIHQFNKEVIEGVGDRPGAGRESRLTDICRTFCGGGWLSAPGWLSPSCCNGEFETHTKRLSFFSKLIITPKVCFERQH